MFRFVLKQVESTPASLDETLQRARVLSMDLQKSIDGNVLEGQFLPLSKADEDKRLVYGVVLIPDQFDRQADYFTPEAIEQMAHGFMEQYQQVGYNHKGALPNSAVKIVESFIAPCDLRINDQAIKKGSWVLGTKVYNDNLWGQVKSGAIRGYSIGGAGQCVEVDQ